MQAPYIFDNLNSPRASDHRLARHMSGAFTSFIHSLDPNHGDAYLPEWPDYRVAERNMVFVADGENAEDDVYRVEGLALWTEERIRGCRGLRAGV